MRLIILSLLILAPSIAVAQSAPSARPEPTQRALAQMVREAMEREAAALAQVYALQERVHELEAKTPDAPKQ